MYTFGTDHVHDPSGENSPRKRTSFLQSNIMYLENGTPSIMIEFLSVRLGTRLEERGCTVKYILRLHYGALFILRLVYFDIFVETSNRTRKGWNIDIWDGSCWINSPWLWTVCFIDFSLEIYVRSKKGLIEYKIFENYHVNFFNFCRNGTLWESNVGNRFFLCLSNWKVFVGIAVKNFVGFIEIIVEY